jgi:DNA-nicking Smr family endonuclease
VEPYFFGFETKNNRLQPIRPTMICLLIQKTLYYEIFVFRLIDNDCASKHWIMKFYRQNGIFRPFENLKALLEDDPRADKKDTGELLPDTLDAETDPQNDQALFEAAMADVEKIARNICVQQNFQRPPTALPDTTDEAETRQHLEKLVKTGEGFVVAHTSEYVEGTGYNVNREVAKRLHRGEFSIQGHIDLHGLTVESARDAFECFLKESVTTGKRMVLIVHGRGLSSPAEPVLKIKVLEWLTTGPWRKWVMAFASARLCDGGTGATYVLLRQRPATKRLKKVGA